MTWRNLIGRVYNRARSTLLFLQFNNKQRLFDSLVVVSGDRFTTMGGGEFVRAAAKMAGAGVVNAGFRGSSMVPQFGQLLRSASKASSVSVGSSSRVPSAKATAGAEVDVVQKPMREIDDWEFANFEDDLAVDADGPEPRIVFGTVPSFEEAKEAAAEVKEALDRYAVNFYSIEFCLNRLMNGSALCSVLCALIRAWYRICSFPFH